MPGYGIAMHAPRTEEEESAAKHTDHRFPALSFRWSGETLYTYYKGLMDSERFYREDHALATIAGAFSYMAYLTDVCHVDYTKFLDRELLPPTN